MNKGRLTISRPSYGDDRKKISIKVKDVDAGVRFLDIEIDYADFAACLTGLAEQDCEFTARGLQNVGKQIQRDSLVFEIGEATRYGVDGMEEIKSLANLATPEGWTASTYFGSKYSFFEKDGKKYAKTPISRWVEKE